MSASASNHNLETMLDCRSQFVRPGVRKFAKTALSRAARRAGKAELTYSPELLGLSNASPDALDDLSLDQWADAILQAAQPCEVASDDLTEEDYASANAVVESELEAAIQVPLHLVGSLPDWMLDQLEGAKGDAFAHLSLFEQKSSTKPAAISMEDELLYS